MSEPTRYEAMGPEVIATPTGEFVMWEDYARLKAEVERLIKAGDVMSNILIGRITSYEIGHAIDQWDAAREGKKP